jgi:molybdenum cofactor cytidylyltransferase
MDHRATQEDGLIVGVLLAAGRGARFDASGTTSKLLAAAPGGGGTAAGTPVALSAALALRSITPRVVAVVRPADSLAQQALHALLRDAGCELAINPRADDGIGSSIAAGVAASPDAAGWLIALADMPAIAADTMAAVRDALRDAPATAPRHRGQRGHPVGFTAALRDDLLALSGDEGARSVLQRHPPRLINVDDPGCLLDLDTPADFAAARVRQPDR